LIKLILYYIILIESTTTSAKEAHMCNLPFWQKKKARKKKYKVLRYLSSAKWGASTYLRAVNGKVVETGNSIWAEEGDDVRFVGIPDLSWYRAEEEPTYLIRVTLALEVEGCKIEVKTNVLIFFRTVEKPSYWKSDGSTYWTTKFDMQELYEKVALREFKHIDDWLTHLFLTAASTNEAVQLAFRRYVKNEKPVRFIQELATALKGLGFSGQPLSNIVAIKITPMVDTMKAMVTVKYGHWR